MRPKIRCDKKFYKIFETLKYQLNLLEDGGILAWSEQGYGAQSRQLHVLNKEDVYRLLSLTICSTPSYHKKYNNTNVYDTK
jgi:hypothetical protein